MALFVGFVNEVASSGKNHPPRKPRPHSAVSSPPVRPGAGPPDLLLERLLRYVDTGEERELLDEVATDRALEGS